jgi:hypothetical protein
VTPARRAAVIVVAPHALTFGIYERGQPERMRARARRAAARTGQDDGDLLAGLAALARARRAAEVVVAVRAPVTGAARRRVLEAVRRLRCTPLVLRVQDEARWLFLGAVRGQRAQDGLAAALEPEGLTLVRWRGRVLAATARLGLREPLLDSGIPPGGAEDVLIVSGSLAAPLAARLRGAATRPPRVTRTAVARLARSRARDPLAGAARAVRRLLDWTGKDAALVLPDALMDGIAATVLRLAVPATGLRESYSACVSACTMR